MKSTKQNMIMLDHNTLHENHNLLKLSGYGVQKDTSEKSLSTFKTYWIYKRQDDKLIYNLVIRIFLEQKKDP